MQVSLKTAGDVAVISPGGRFNFKIHPDFKRCSDAALADDKVRSIAIDMQAVEYLDSSALGMLLLLRERAQERGLSVQLRNCRASVREILDIANFGSIFPLQ